MSLAFGGVGSVGREGSNAVGSAWATPVDLKTLAIPPPINKKPPLFVYSLFDPSDGRVMVWILEVPESVFKGGKLDEKSLKSWLQAVHEEAYKQFTGEGNQINWLKGHDFFGLLRGVCSRFSFLSILYDGGPACLAAMCVASSCWLGIC